MPAPIKNMQSFLKPRCLLTRDGDENFISVEFFIFFLFFLDFRSIVLRENINLWILRLRIIEQ